MSSSDFACLAHSVLLLSEPAPPDLWNGLPQVEWLSELPLDFDSIYRYSTSSDPFDDGHVRPHFGVSMGRPILPSGLCADSGGDEASRRRTFPHRVFNVGARQRRHDGALFLVASHRGVTILEIAQLAVLLFVLEISAWHHAHCCAGPGTIGCAPRPCVDGLLGVAYHDSLVRESTPRVDFRLWLSATAALSYTASLVQLCIFAVRAPPAALDRGAALAHEARRPDAASA